MICERCNRNIVDEKAFYHGRKGQIYPICKQCLREGKLIDPEEPSTYFPILERLDLPYFGEYWWLIKRRCEERFDSSNLGTATLKKYISYMKLNDFRIFSWRDNKKIEEWYQEKVNHDWKLAMRDII